jgi:hypothetical protein
VQTLTGSVSPDGALVDVLIGLAAPDVLLLRRSGRPIPQPVAARALLDSGADASCVEPALLAPLLAAGLALNRLVIANMPATGGMNLAGEYNTSLTVVHPSGNARANLVVRNHPLVEQPLGVLGYQVLLGRDFLDRCALFLDGPSRAFTLAY